MAIKRIKMKPFLEWDVDTRRILTEKLTIEPDSMLSEYIRKYPEHLLSFVIFDAWEPVAWAIRVVSGRNTGESFRTDYRGMPRTGEVMFYVLPRYRQRGLGGRLVRRIKRDYTGEPTFYYPWDERSVRFFENTTPRRWTAR